MKFVDFQFKFSNMASLSFVQMFSGRKQESEVWRHFTYNAVTHKSTCNVIMLTLTITLTQPTWSRICRKQNKDILLRTGFKYC